MTIELINGDITQVSTSFAADFDAMIVDPPYSQYVHAHAASMGVRGRGPRKRDLGFAACSRRLRVWLGRATAHVKGWSLIFSDIESAHLWRLAATAPYIRSVVSDGEEEGGYVGALPWVRWSQPQLSGDRPPTGAELVSVFWGGGGQKSWRGPGGLMSFRRRSLRGKDKYSCEKPLDLMLDCVSWFSAPDQIIFDPCMGAGTTGVACRLLGRSFVGVEAQAEPFSLAQQRLKAPLSRRDRDRALEWAETTTAEAQKAAAVEATEQTRARAQARLEDADRVRIAALR